MADQRVPRHSSSASDACARYPLRQLDRPTSQDEGVYGVRQQQADSLGLPRCQERARLSCESVLISPCFALTDLSSCVQMVAAGKALHEGIVHPSLRKPVV